MPISGVVQAPSRSSPLRSPSRARLRRSATSRSNCRACARIRSPCSVIRTVRPTRTIRGAPSSRSSACNCCATADGLSVSARAAAAIDPCSTTATKVRRKLMSIVSLRSGRGCLLTRLVVDGQSLQRMAWRGEEQAGEIADHDRGHDRERQIPIGMDQAEDPHDQSQQRRGDDADRDALPVGAAGEHAERVGARATAAEQAEQLDGKIQQRMDVHPGKDDRDTDADQADEHAHPFGEAHRLRLCRVAELAVEIDRQQSRDRIDDARQRTHRGGEQTGDDQAGDPGGQFGTDKGREHRVDRQHRVQLCGVLPIIGEQHGADDVEHEGAGQEHHREYPDRPARFLLGRCRQYALHQYLILGEGEHDVEEHENEEAPQRWLGDVEAQIDHVGLLECARRIDDRHQAELVDDVADREARAAGQHHHLEDVGPHHRLHAAERGVDDREDADDDDAGDDIGVGDRADRHRWQEQDDAHAPADLHQHP
eukprot:Opistho-1_new@70632